ncbi:FixH family protein [Parvicella tangerina]|uniref:Nitrogen fixation protein FixH n=1 Tax=Parvicella tangerina TaxID=2829795 RepID=A0A916NFK8_9FLAO|nr:FixH family protein [Parvicella tangerina]CAG5078784.1 hypothetical protein CRYO30217_00766 [Parvicella tangerina]
MKFNWGVGITIAIVAFMTFILSFVFRAAQTDTDLTSEDYYEQEINYQETIDAKNNAVGLKSKFKLFQQEEYFIISFPEEVSSVESGNIHFYRPENADLDKHYDLELNNGMMALPLKSLSKGGYKVTISWVMNGKTYAVEEKITIE